MSEHKQFKALPKAPEPRRWHFKEKDVRKVLRLVDKFQAKKTGTAHYNLWRALDKIQPASAGTMCNLKTTPRGIPYLEEAL